MRKAVYTIVTNDEFEEIVAVVPSAKQAADYIGISYTTFLSYMSKNTWYHRNKYKAIKLKDNQPKKQTQREQYNSQEKWRKRNHAKLLIQESNYRRKRREAREMLRPVYERNKEFKDYVDRYAKCRRISIEIALTHKTVEEAADYYEKKHEGKVIDEDVQ